MSSGSAAAPQKPHPQGPTAEPLDIPTVDQRYG